MVYWDTFHSRLDVTADLVAKTALRVGVGGEAAEPTATDLPVLKNPDGQPFIPGSSLRGVLRSHVERIVRTLESPGTNGRGSCVPVVESEGCVTSRQMSQWREKVRQRSREKREKESDDLWLARHVWEKSCRVCRVFGSPWLASRVRIADLHPNGVVRTEVRDGVSIHRDKGTVENKYDFETVPAETRFRLFIAAENLEKEERGLLWLGVRELERGYIHLGGFKGRGLGHVKLESLTLRGVESEDRPALRAYLLEGHLSTIPLETADGWLTSLVNVLEGGA